MSDVVLDFDEPRVIIRPMLTTNYAVDLFLGDLARRGYSDRTRDTYSRILNKLCDRLPADLDVSRITTDDCRRFLDQWNKRSAGTRAHTYAVLSSFFGWLERNEKIKRSPIANLQRPRRIRPDDIDVVAIDADGVRKLLAAGQTWTEKLAVAIPAYIGPRRRAVARLRLRDYDVNRQLIRFREKGGKVIWKPVPQKLASLLGAAIADGAIVDQADYLVPPEGHLRYTDRDRDDRIIWRVVKRVAARAGVDTTVHALRAAFACFYLEEHPGDTFGLKELLGHSSFDTTEVYLRKLDRGAAMERVRTLDWDTPSDGDDFGDVLEELTSRVYFVAAGDIRVDGVPVKIGTAVDPVARLADLQAGHHEVLALAAAVPGGRALEQKLHELLAGDLLRGEWFRSSERLRALLAVLENRMATGEASHLGQAALTVMGAGGFEPPFATTPDAEPDSGEPRPVVRTKAARAAAQLRRELDADPSLRTAKPAPVSAADPSPIRRAEPSDA